MRDQPTRRHVLTATGAATIAALAGCSSSDAEPAPETDDTNDSSEQTADSETPTNELLVGSKRFIENVLLAEMSVSVLEDRTDLESIGTDDIGERTTVESFLYTKYGGLDHYWEYTGTLERSHYANDSLDSLEAIRERAARDGIAVLEPGGFDNTYELVTTDEFAADNGLERVSDLAGLLEETDVKLSLGDEFAYRDDGWVGFMEAYGVADDRATEIREAARVVEAGDTYTLLEDGDAEVVMGFSTDPELADDHLLTLEDDEAFFPEYLPVAVVAESALERTPEIESSLNDVASRLESVDTMRDLIGRVHDGETAATVARDFLE